MNTKDKFQLDQNHQKLNEISDPSKANLGLFFGIFFWKFSRNEIGGWGSNSWLLKPYDET
jgi:hypothetical protein